MLNFRVFSKNSLFAKYCSEFGKNLSSNHNFIRINVISIKTSRFSTANTSPTTPPTPPWREASSLIIVSRAKVAEKAQEICDYRLMMVKRNQRSSFMASAFVFPGGVVEWADYSPKWWQLFQKLGLSRIDLEVFSSSVVGPRPAIIRLPQTLKQTKLDSSEGLDYLPADIALRIAAIRETFEETGVLLLTKTHLTNTSVGTQSQHSTRSVPISDLEDMSTDLVQWREKVRKNPNSFLELCLEVGLCPDLWSLYEWSDWLTPINEGLKRFEAIFYICCLDTEPKVFLDNSEVTMVKWCTPVQMLEEHNQQRVFLAPPQVYELSRLYNLPNFKTVEEFAAKRQTMGTECWMPVMSTYKNGTNFVLPGDDHYPMNPNPDINRSLEEVRAESTHVNRLELHGLICQAFCNIKLNCRHLSPVTYPPIPKIEQSMS